MAERSTIEIKHIEREFAPETQIIVDGIPLIMEPTFNGIFLMAPSGYQFVVRPVSDHALRLQLAPLGSMQNA